MCFHKFLFLVIFSWLLYSWLLLRFEKVSKTVWIPAFFKTIYWGDFKFSIIHCNRPQCPWQPKFWDEAILNTVQFKYFQSSVQGNHNIKFQTDCLLILLKEPFSVHCFICWEWSPNNLDSWELHWPLMFAFSHLENDNTTYVYLQPK